MASLSTTYSGDLTTSIANQIWIARNTAAAAKGEASDVAKAYGVDPKFVPGEFMSRALQMQATSMLPERFQRQMPSVTMGDPSYLARGQQSTSGYYGSSPIDPKPTNSQTMNRLAGQPFPWVGVGSSLKNQVTPQSNVVNKPTTTTPTTKKKGTKVHDEKLGNFLSAVSLSLSATIDSMNNKLNESETALIQVKDGITNVHKQLENSGDTLEEKLDAIISALRDQNNFNFKRKKTEDARVEELQTEAENIDSGTNQIQKTFEDDDEFERRQALDDEEERTRQFLQANQNQQINPMQIQDPWSDAQQLERGGIISGPDSGYPVILHGEEAVIPLDNNFTQREPSAIDGKISSPRPRSTVVNNYSQINQQVEKGTPSIQKFGLNFFNSAVRVDRKEQKKASNKIYDIITTPIATIGGTVTNLLQQLIGNLGETGSKFFSSLIDGVSSLFKTENSIKNIQSSTISDSSLLNTDNTNVSNNFETSKSIASSDGGHTPFTHSGAIPTMLSSTVNNSQTSVLSEWWNKGRNMRVPNESSASWKTLMSDDMKQITKTNKAFKEGAKGIKGWRPLKAFTPNMFKTGPTPAVRQLVERPLGALAGGSKILGKGVAGGLGSFIMDMVFPEPVSSYDQMTGPNAFYNNPKLTEEQRIFYMKSIHSNSVGTNIQVQSAEQSKENALGSLDQNITNSAPIVINNSSNTESSEQVAIDHIATSGDPGLDQFYPSPY